MLPHDHFLVAGLAVSSLATILLPEQPVAETAQWIIIGGLASAAVDLDIVALVLMRSRQEPRLRRFRSIIEIHRKFDLFMDTITETGVLRTGLMTHLLTATAITLFFFFCAKDLIIPVTAGTLSHILSDTQYLRRLSA